MTLPADSRKQALLECRTFQKPPRPGTKLRRLIYSVKRRTRFYSRSTTTEMSKKRSCCNRSRINLHLPSEFVFRSDKFLQFNGLPRDLNSKPRQHQFNEVFNSDLLFLFHQDHLTNLTLRPPVYCR